MTIEAWDAAFSADTFLNVATYQLDILTNDNIVYTKSFSLADALGQATAY